MTFLFSVITIAEIELSRRRMRARSSGIAALSLDDLIEVDAVAVVDG